MKLRNVSDIILTCVRLSIMLPPVNGAVDCTRQSQSRRSPAPHRQGDALPRSHEWRRVRASGLEWSVMTSNELRSSFLQFFERHGHRIVSSSPLVPQDDPTLLFTNAGMNQFKDLFLGHERRDYPRATTSQKCMRVSGKHNDLDNVGPSLRHHTFFEMLGNFSFGDYFKHEAVPFAWELLTTVWRLGPDRLYPTIFKGEAGIPRDEEAYDVWRKFLPVQRIGEL